MSYQEFPPSLLTLSPRLTRDGDPSSSIVGINTTPLADGAFLYCIENKAEYQLDRTSTVVPDGTAVIEPSAGPGRWLMRLPASNGSATWKDPVATAAALPLLGNVAGDARVTLDTGMIWVWNGLTWVTNTGVLPAPTVPGDILQLGPLNTPEWGPVPVALAITSFTTGRGLFIAGQTSANPATFSAAYNQTPDSVTIHDDQGNPTLAFGVTPFTAGSYPFAYTKNGVANVNYTLTATKVPGGTPTRTVSDGWGFQIYHGAAASVTTATDIHALAVNVVSQSRSVPNFPATSLGANFDWFCLPSSFGTPSFTDITTNFPVAFILTGTVAVTNAFGITVNYDIWRSLNPGIGTAGTIVIHVS